MAKDYDPNRWVLLAACNYAATLHKFRLAASLAEQDRLRHELSSACIMAQKEYDREYNWRRSRIPHLFKRYEQCRDEPLSLLFDSSESEAIRHFASVPPAPAMKSISSRQCLNVADLFEGWAQSPAVDPFNMARCLGRADGFRTLVEAIGSDYEPPEMASGEADTLLKFVARRMK